MSVVVNLLQHRSLSIQHKQYWNRTFAYPICLYVCPGMNCGKMADWIWMLFGVMGGVSWGIDVLDQGGDRWSRRGSFGSEFGVSHCNQWGLCGVLVQKCANRSSCHLGWWVRSIEGWVYYMGSMCPNGRFRGFLPHWF